MELVFPINIFNAFEKYDRLYESSENDKVQFLKVSENEENKFFIQDRDDPGNHIVISAHSIYRSKKGRKSELEAFIMDVAKNYGAIIDYDYFN